MMEVDVWRETDATRINALINLPEIRRDVQAGDEYLDMEPGLRDPSNFLLMGEWGGQWFVRMLPGVYEVHTVVHPGARGRWTWAMVNACLKWMFTRTDAYEIITRVPEGHKAALALTVGLAKTYGGGLECVLPAATVFRGRRQDLHIYSFRIQDWLPRAPGLDARGRWLHERMHQEAERLGIVEPMHDDDPIHNQYVGAAVEMAFGGQPLKAVMTYNRYARMVRHRTIELVAQNAIKFDIGTMVFGERDIEVVP